MGLLLVLALAIAATVVLTSTAATAAPSEQASHCRVGEPTPWHTARFGWGESHVKFFSPVLVLACGRTGFLHAGPLEIVGYDTEEGLCTSAQVRHQMLFGGICFSEGISWQDFTSKPLKWDGAGWSGGGPLPTQTNLAGYIDTSVANVEVRFHREGKIWAKAATVAQVDGGLLAKLGVAEPFGRFAALLPGCVPPRAIRVVARGASGEFLGAERGRSLLPHFCHLPPPPGPKEH